jgi:hypothetical protein
MSKKKKYQILEHFTFGIFGLGMPAQFICGEKNRSDEVKCPF